MIFAAGSFALFGTGPDTLLAAAELPADVAWLVEFPSISVETEEAAEPGELAAAAVAAELTELVLMGVIDGPALLAESAPPPPPQPVNSTQHANITLTLSHGLLSVYRNMVALALKTTHKTIELN